MYTHGTGKKWYPANPYPLCKFRFKKKVHSWLPFKEKFPHLFTAWAFCSNNSYSFLGFSSPRRNLDNKQLTTGSCNSQVVCSEKSWLLSVHSFAFLALKHCSTNQNYPHKCASYGQLHYLQLWKILLMGIPTSLGNFYPSGPPPPRNFHWPSRGKGSMDIFRIHTICRNVWSITELMHDNMESD